MIDSRCHIETKKCINPSTWILVGNLCLMTSFAKTKLLGFLPRHSVQCTVYTVFHFHLLNALKLKQWPIKEAFMSLEASIEQEAFPRRKNWEWRRSGQQLVAKERISENGGNLVTWLAGPFQVGCRSMFIHVKGWVVVRGSGWLKDSSGGRGCNKRNGYSGPARMPSLRDEQSDMFTQQRVASYNCENAYPRLSAIPLATVPAAPRFISFAVQRRCYFHYASRFISVRWYAGIKRQPREYSASAMVYRFAWHRKRARGTGSPTLGED